MKKYLLLVYNIILLSVGCSLGLMAVEPKCKIRIYGAVLIEGCKWCGKSMTAKQFSNSLIEFQNPDMKMQYDKINQTKPSLFLAGDKPGLFDEWQMGAIEVKLEAGEIDDARCNLLKFKEKVDTSKYGEPSFLMVLTGAELSYKGQDGIYVVSIGNLKN